MGWREEGGFEPDDYTDLRDYVLAVRDYEFKRGWRPRHPQLFAYEDDKAAWIDAFIHPELIYAEKSGEWNFVLREPIRDVLAFPFVTPRFCRALIEEGEHFDHFLAENEGPNRPDNYPTTDVRLESFPHPSTGEGALGAAYLEMIQKFVTPIVWHQWKYEPEFFQWPFLARYTPGEQPFLGLHHDTCTMALVVMLNEEGKDFEGGGTFFERERYHHRSVPVGYASLHPARLTHRHGAKAVTEGARYVLNAFIV